LVYSMTAPPSTPIRISVLMCFNTLLPFTVVPSRSTCSISAVERRRLNQKNEKGVLTPPRNTWNTTLAFSLSQREVTFLFYLFHLLCNKPFPKPFPVPFSTPHGASQLLTQAHLTPSPGGALNEHKLSLLSTLPPFCIIRLISPPRCTPLPKQRWTTQMQWTLASGGFFSVDRSWSWFRSWFIW
jgi:hypothetical protein